MDSDYHLLDTGNGKRLEQFNKIRIVRAAKQADWAPSLPKEEWLAADAVFENDKWNTELKDFTVHFSDITFCLSLMESGQLGVFPEQQKNWQWLAEITQGERHHILNGFAYTGGSTLFSSNHINKVTHLDASKPAIKRAKQNLEFSFKSDNKVRFIQEDVITFMKKEVKRGKRYDGFIFDPPAFGKGGKGKTWKLSKDLPLLMELTYELAGGSPSFMLLSAHDPALDHKYLAKTIRKLCPVSAEVESGDLVMKTQNGNFMNNGYFARFIV
ncbi:conserved hypothetical protein [Denitrovibrio acetiphilus DSM 12809]|uniref:S-adenosylmethionine-dependent methyltransferase domain-containing protein n=1 Tax=Denitrovibrio acetiphilus (strain DSM 12809 / NBRC 114555 / N2460) TaxID=522772 RepID=D4H599_DENA2|nr:class I SAM-dependent methyltransferase [Denitrovibrio acetiphilus]ADD67519.1 conserved hypothetical protein [Denitrovibrio acetiphilus DSM 12809]